MNISLGTDVAQTFAFDDDATEPNNKIVYRIESGGLDKFRINSDTGEITVIEGSNLDRDVFEIQYSLSILAIDRGTPPNTGMIRQCNINCVTCTLIFNIYKTSSHICDAVTDVTIFSPLLFNHWRCLR